MEEQPMPRLAGKIAFITGAGTGIGRATAILLAREGAKVAIAEIDPASGEETAHLAGNGSIAIPTDVTDPESLERAIRATVDKFGGLHVLHNNAGELVDRRADRPDRKSTRLNSSHANISYAGFCL